MKCTNVPEAACDSAAALEMKSQSKLHWTTARSRLASAPRSLAAFLLATAVLALATSVFNHVQPPTPAAAQGALEAWRVVEEWPGAPSPNPPGYLLGGRYLAVDDAGTVFVSDRLDSRIHVLSGGDWIHAWGSPGRGPGQLERPAGIALLGDEVLVADSGNGRVVRFNRDGGFLGEWTGFERPWAIAVVPGTGRVLVSDLATDQVFLVAADGRRLATYGGPGTGPGLLDGPVGLAAWPDGRIAVADQGNLRVQIWSAGGAFEQQLAVGNRPVLDVTAVGEDGLYFIDERTAYRRDLSGDTPDRNLRVGFERANGGIAVQSLNDEVLWITLRHDWRFQTGLRRWPVSFGPNVSPRLDWLDFPRPPGALAGPRRVSAGGSADSAPDAFVALDAWPRIQRFDTDGAVTGMDLVEAVGEAELRGDGRVLALTPGFLRLLDGEAPSWEWQPPFPGTWLAGLGYDASSDLSYALDLRGQEVHIVNGSGQAVGQWPLDAMPGAWRTIADLAVRSDGRLLLVDRTSALVEVRDPSSGAVLDRWPVIGVPARIAADTAADNRGGAFVLTREGWVWRLDDSGAVRAWWSAARDARGGAVAPTDLAVARDGRVVVLDGANDRALVYAPNPGAPPPLAPTGEGCTFLRDKRAAPPRITIGDTVGVTLTVTGECLGQGQGADIVLVVDRSGSMQGQKLAAAKAAVAAFVGDLDFAQSRAAMVIFNLEAELRVPLSADPGAVLAGLSAFDAGGGTDIGKAIDVAADELRDNGRPGVEPIIVVMTDGRPDSAEVDADDAAIRAKSAGIRLFTIGFGPDTDSALMQRMASGAGDYFFAPTEAELAGIYLEIARRISGGVILETATITDVVPANMDFIVGSAQPLATWNAPTRTITWQIANARAGLTLSYRLRPTQTGTHPTNVDARMRYRDGLQTPGELIFPVPRVTVLGPPRPIFLPMAMRSYCPPKARPADVALVIDTSSSMTGPKLAAAKAAATSFVDLLALPFDHATIIGFDTRPRLAAMLTGDADALRVAIDGLSITPGTVIDAGLRTATAELFGRRRRADALPVLVLLTDGQNNAGPAPVLGAAAAARAAGARIYTIALGEDADPELMRQVAGNPARAFVAPGPDDLAQIYADIAALIPCD